MTHIKEYELEPCSVYTDSKGKEFLYIGRFYIRGCFKTFSSEKEYLESEIYENFLDRISDKNYPAYFVYIPLTKRTKDIIARCSNLNEVFEAIFSRTNPISYKLLTTPLKLISKVNDMTFGGLTNRFFPDEYGTNYIIPKW